MATIVQKLKKFILGAIILLFLMFPSERVWASDITPDRVIGLVNESRLSYKEGVLVQNDLLMKVAQMKIDDMFQKGYFAHTSPEGKTPWIWFDSAGYDYQYAGENLAIHFISAESQQGAWMESASHRKNILNPEYHEIGVAVRRGVLEGKNTIVTVQEFGSRNGVNYGSSETLAKVASAENYDISFQDMQSRMDFLNNTYEQMLTLFWGIMIVQVCVLGWALFLNRKLTHVRSTEREYKIQVHVRNGEKYRDGFWISSMCDIIEK